MYSNDVYGARINHQATDPISRLFTTVDDSTAIDAILPVMLVLPTEKRNDKLCIKAVDVVEDYNVTDFCSISPGLPAMSPVTTS